LKEFQGAGALRSICEPHVRRAPQDAAVICCGGQLLRASQGDEGIQMAASLQSFEV